MTALAPRPRLLDVSPSAQLDAAIDGDERAWEALCERHLPDVRSVARARLRDPHAAEDVVQETMLRAWSRLHQVRDADRLGAWLKTIAANVAVDHVRRERATAPLHVVGDAATDEPGHDEVLVAREEAAVLHQHLATLRDRDRQALWQRDGLGMPVGDVAAELGMTPGSVRVLLTRARKRVREGYGVLAAPALVALDRLRSRWAGLGDAVPVALAVPAVVVVATALTVQPPPVPAPPATVTVVDAAPDLFTTQPAAAQLRTPEPAPAPAPTAAATVLDAPAASPSPHGAAPTGRTLGVGGARAGFHDEAPTDDNEDISSSSPAGPVEGIDVFLEETGLGGALQSEGQGDCLLCG